MIVKIQVRRGLSTQWTSVNPILSSGEFGYETDTGKLKIGNGATAWVDLQYLQAEGLELTSPITGYTIGPNTPLTEDDSILDAFGKLEGQSNAKISGNISSGQVSFGIGTNSVGSSSRFRINNTESYSGTGTATEGAPRIFIGGKTPSIDDSAILIGRNLVGNGLFSHAIRDESTFNSGPLDSAYASFDSTPIITGSSPYNHLRSYQSRPIYNGTALIGEINGFGFTPTVGAGSVTNLYGIKIDNGVGAGSVVNQVGLWINNLTKGTTSNFAIYSNGTTPSYHGGAFQIGGLLSANAATITNLVNVGTLAISSNTPTAGLDVNVSTRLRGTIQLDSISAGRILFIGSTGNFVAGSSSLYLDPTTFKLGIGTSSPVGLATFFTGLSTATFDPVNQQTGSVSISNGAAINALPILSGKSNDNSGLHLMSLTNNTNSNPDFIFSARENDNSDYSTLTSSAFRFSRFATALVDILRNGSVGILTSSPTNTLDVNGTARIRTRANSTGNFATWSATGVAQERTPIQASDDILKSISGYNAGISQRLEHNASGVISWVNT